MLATITEVRIVDESERMKQSVQFRKNVPEEVTIDTLELEVNSK